MSQQIKDDAQVEGEGSYTATHRYNEGVEQSVKAGRSPALAEAASKALDGPEAKTLRAAEAAGKAGHAIKGTVSAEKILPHLPVVCSENGQFAVVDHMESPDTIKLAKDKGGQHHYIPLSWVVFVDDKVHIDRPGDQAMRDWSSTPPRLS
jgi:hypothetical protein